jgi:abortive infection bacteriophage resistance protein
VFVLHHRENYVDVPIWVLTEVLDFGDLSKLHEALPRDLRDRVAKPFMIRDNPSRKQVKSGSAGPGGVLVDWLQTITLVRNVAAHHGRTYNRRFPLYATARLREMPKFDHVTQSNAPQLYGVICLLDHMVSAIDPGNRWRQDLEHDLALYKADLGEDLSSLGYPVTLTPWP